MDALINSMSPGGGKGIRMSSRQIADLTDKKHQHVKRDIEKLCAELQEDVSNFGRIYLDSLNREQTEYMLDRDMTENLLMGYSAPLRQKVIARMRELEALLSAPKTATTAEMFLQSAQVLLGIEKRQEEHAVALIGVDDRLKRVEDTAPFKVKPQNTETISEIRARMNSKYHLPPQIVDFVVTKITYRIRPFGMVKNSHEQAQGSSFTVYHIIDVSNLFKRFVSECTQVTPTTCTHPEIERRFKLIK